MTETFERRDAFEAAADGYRVTTTAFEGVVTRDDRTYTVTVRVPTLDAATVDEVGDIVALDWFETMERRLEDAPKATRTPITLEEFAVEEDGGELRIEYVFTSGHPGTAADVAKTFAEYVEGTYVESIIPGYEYEGVVADLLASASQSGDSGTPL